MKAFLSILLWGVLLCNLLYSQTSKVDSLKLALENTVTDSSKILILKDISWEYLNNRSNMPLAKKYIDSFYLLSQKSNYKYGFALANYQYGVLERQKGNYDAALIYLDRYLAYCTEKKDEKAIANGLYQKTIILDSKGQYDESFKIFYKILKIYEKLEDSYSIATILNALGETLKRTGKLNEAMENYTKALEIFVDLDAKADMANGYYNIGDLYLIKKNYREALNFFNSALFLDQDINSLWGTAYDYEAIGKVYSLQENHKKALEVHLRAMEIREQLGQKRELAESHTHLGIAYFKLKNYQKASFHLEKAISLAERIGARPEAQYAYEMQSKVYAATGDYKKALALKDKYIAVKDSLFSETKSKQIEELQVKFDSEKKQDAIATLEKDAEINDLKLKRQTTFRNITIGIALATILLSFILFNRYRYRQRVKREAEEKKRLIYEERQKTETEKKRVEELQKIDKLKDEFLANTSHELRTPLNGIIGLTESLKDGVAGKLSHKAIENLDMIVNSGRRLSHLVNDILDFSKLKNKDLELTINAIDMHAIVDVVLQLSEPLTIDKNLKLVNSIPKNISLVAADENRLQQILHNLVGNAIKFTEKGAVTIDAKEKNGMVSITVSDTGIGIAEEKFERVFKSFEQADGSIEREYGGTGLGLSVTKQLVELHNGSIHIASKVGEGSTFTFTLPKSDKKRENVLRPEITSHEKIASIQADTTNESNFPHMESTPKNTLVNILIVDDEPVNRRVLENHLTVAGYSVTEAHSGKEALELIGKGLIFDLVLLDVMMPGMSGYEVCQTLRKKYMASELPIVLLTAKNRVSDLVIGFNVGANDYLTKPFSKNELLSRIKMHLNLNGIHKATSKFVPTEFIKSVGREAITEVALGDHVEKDVTVLFTDVREYTRLAESMTPQQNFKFVNAYVGKMGPIIQQNKGFVNQYLGDGIMALFPHDALHALQAAIDMQKAIISYNERRITDGYVPISVGMGLHTGPLVMGIIGDVNRNDTAIIADTVNTASRMEGVTKYYGANIIISEDSLQTIAHKEMYHFRFLGKVKVKGKEKAIGIYECFDGDNPEIIALKISTLKAFEKGLAHFFSNEFPSASAAFDKVLNKNPGDMVAKYFVTRSAEYTISGIPKDGEMVNKMHEK
ncbi:MAG: tetratricopeptide repeat protein [Saonia sp.]